MDVRTDFKKLHEEGKRSWIITLLLSLFIGEFGIDRFYIGKIGTGILKLITLGGFGVWWIVDIVLILIHNMKDGKGQSLE